MRPPQRDVGAAAAALVLAVACSRQGVAPPAPEEGRRLPRVYPVAAFGSEHPDRMRIWGTPSAEWVGTGSAYRRALVAAGSSGVWVKPGFAAERLDATVGLAGACAAGAPRVTFRVLTARDPAGSRRTVWESAAMGPGDAFVAVALTLRPEPGSDWVGLEAEVAPAKGCPELRTAWLDPVLTALEAAPEPKRRPNVLLVTADTTRYDALLDPSGKPSLPAMAELAADGVVLRRAFSVAYGTSPSHASLLSSTHASRHGVFDNRTVLPAEETTLAEVLAAQGYATAAFVGAVPVSRALGFTQGFQLYDDVFAHDPRSGLGEFSRHERRADTTATLFSRWLAVNRDGPFFAWLHFFDPHQPYAPREAAAAMPPAPGRPPPLLRTPDGAPKVVLLEEGRQDAETERRIEAEVKIAYGREVAFMDAQLGRVLRRLRDAGVYDQTLIVLVADHGETFLERGPAVAFRHAGLHTEVASLPAVIKLPGGAPAAGVRDALVGNVDLAPTVLELLGIPVPPTWQGRSIAPLLLAGGMGPRRPLLLEGAHRGEVSVRTAERMYRRVTLPGATPELLRDMAYRGEAEELFDLERDPRELRNLAASDPACTAEMRALADELLAEARPAGEPEENDALDSEEHRKGLEALGYLQ